MLVDRPVTLDEQRLVEVQERIRNAIRRRRTSTRSNSFRHTSESVAATFAPCVQDIKLPATHGKIGSRLQIVQQRAIHRSDAFSGIRSDAWISDSG